MDNSDVIELLRDLDRKVEMSFRDMRNDITDLKDSVNIKVQDLTLKVEKHDHDLSMAKHLFGWSFGAISLPACISWIFELGKHGK